MFKAGGSATNRTCTAIVSEESQFQNLKAMSSIENRHEETLSSGSGEKLSAKAKPPHAAFEWLCGAKGACQG